MSDEQRNVAATVKWFKPDKGYGFVRLADGTGEAFLHVSALPELGDVTLTEGMSLVCDVAQGPKGPQVAAVYAVHAETAAPVPEGGKDRKPRRRARARTGEPVPQVDAPEPQQAGGEPRRRERPAATSDPTSGTVRWYNLDGQCGIIDPHHGGEGVLFDRAALRRSGMDVVADGEDVWYVARDTMEGPVADWVSLARIDSPQ